MNSIVWPGDVSPSQAFGCTDLLVEPYWLQAQCHWHCGIDIPLDVGTPLHAARGGTVLYVGYGLLAIKATPTQTDWYVHIDSAHVPIGAPIDRGNLVAYSGAKVPAGGSLTGPHLHFEVQEGALNAPSTSLDPVPVLTEAFGPSPGNLTGDDMLPDERQTLLRDDTILSGSRLNTKAVDQALIDLAAQIASLKVDVAALKTAGPTGTPIDLAPLEQVVANVQTIVTRIETALKAA